MNKKAALLTISTFLVFISFVALFSAMHNQQINSYKEMSTLAAIDSVFYIHDSIKTGISEFHENGWDVSIWSIQDQTNVDIWINFPETFSSEKAERFVKFADNNTRQNISADIDLNQLQILPQDIIVTSNSEKITTTPKNTEYSVGAINEYFLDFYWNGTAQPIRPDTIDSVDGIDITINVHATQGKKLRTYTGTLDPFSDSLIQIHVSAGNNTPQSSKIINVSLNSPGNLEIYPEEGIKFRLFERIGLESDNAVYIESSSSKVIVQDDVYQIWKSR